MPAKFDSTGTLSNFIHDTVGNKTQKNKGEITRFLEKDLLNQSILLDFCTLSLFFNLQPFINQASATIAHRAEQANQYRTGLVQSGMINDLGSLQDPSAILSEGKLIAILEATRLFKDLPNKDDYCLDNVVMLENLRSLFQQKELAAILFPTLKKPFKPFSAELVMEAVVLGKIDVSKLDIKVNKRAAIYKKLLMTFTGLSLVTTMVLAALPFIKQDEKIEPTSIPPEPVTEVDTSTDWFIPRKINTLPRNESDLQAGRYVPFEKSYPINELDQTEAKAPYAESEYKLFELQKQALTELYFGSDQQFENLNKNDQLMIGIIANETIITRDERGYPIILFKNAQGDNVDFYRSMDFGFNINTTYDADRNLGQTLVDFPMNWWNNTNRMTLGAKCAEMNLDVLNSDNEPAFPYIANNIEKILNENATNMSPEERLFYENHLVYASALYVFSPNGVQTSKEEGVLSYISSDIETVNHATYLSNLMNDLEEQHKTPTDHLTTSEFSDSMVRALLDTFKSEEAFAYQVTYLRDTPESVRNSQMIYLWFISRTINAERDFTIQLYDAIRDNPSWQRLVEEDPQYQTVYTELARKLFLSRFNQTLHTNPEIITDQFVGQSIYHQILNGMNTEVGTANAFLLRWLEMKSSFWNYNIEADPTATTIDSIDTLNKKPQAPLIIPDQTPLGFIMHLDNLLVQ